MHVDVTRPNAVDLLRVQTRAWESKRDALVRTADKKANSKDPRDADFSLERELAALGPCPVQGGLVGALTAEGAPLTILETSTPPPPPPETQTVAKKDPRAKMTKEEEERMVRRGWASETKGSPVSGTRGMLPIWDQRHAQPLDAAVSKTLPVPTLVRLPPAQVNELLSADVEATGKRILQLQRILGLPRNYTGFPQEWDPLRPLSLIPHLALATPVGGAWRAACDHALTCPSTFASILPRSLPRARRQGGAAGLSGRRRWRGRPPRVGQAGPGPIDTSDVEARGTHCGAGAVRRSRRKAPAVRTSRIATGGAHAARAPSPSNVRNQ